VTEAIQHQNVGSNVLLGRFGPELAVMAEAAGRKNMEQVIGSDEPVALAIGLTVTNNLLIGEEFLAAGAYLQGRPVQVASLQLQDILRYLAAGSVLLVAVYRLVVG
jgi:hypothetical protein